MTDREYFAIDAVNATLLKHMLVSPRHYKWAKDHPDEPTPAMAKGTALHCALFEPDQLAGRIAVHRLNWSTTAGKIEKSALEASGLLILKEAELEEAKGAAAAVRANPDCAAYLEAGEAEIPITWTDHETGLPCKAKIDWHSTSKPCLLDLKSAADIGDRKWSYQARDMGYWLQAAFYLRGWAETHDGEVLQWVWLPVESEGPFDSCARPADPGTLAIWDQKVSACLHRVAECGGSGKWPGQFDGPTMLIEPPGGR